MLTIKIQKTYKITNFYKGFLIPNSGSGYTFRQWSDGVTDSTRTRTLTIDGDKALTATFQTTQSGGGGEENGGSIVG